MRGWFGLAARSAASVAGLACILDSAAGHEVTTPTWIGVDESIVILESPRFYFDWEHRKLPLNIDLFRCATRQLHEKYPRVRLIAQRDFVKQAFPDLDPKAAPVSPESLQLLLDNATLQGRIAPLHIRYLVYGGTANDIETVWQGFGCASAGEMGGVCAGGGEWKKRSSYDVVVIDLRRHQESRAANAARGTSWYVTVLPLLVVGWKSPTEARVCDGLGSDVLQLLDTGATAPVARAGRSIP